MTDAKDIAGEVARNIAGEFGHALASDLLEHARAKNPSLTIEFDSTESSVVLVVTTPRGVIRRARNPYEGWIGTFRALGLL